MGLWAKLMVWAATCFSLKALGENSFSCLSQRLEGPTFLGSWPLPPSSKPAIFLASDLSDSDSCLPSTFKTFFLFIRAFVITLGSSE